MMKMLTLILAAMAACIIAAGCGPKEAPSQGKPAAEKTPAGAAAVNATAGQDDKALFEASCSKCHSVDKVAKFDEAVPWKTIVDRMITARGAKIGAEDASKIVAYLEKTYPKK